MHNSLIGMAWECVDADFIAERASNKNGCEYAKFHYRPNDVYLSSFVVAMHEV